MRQHTLIFDMDIGLEDIELFERCTGVMGVAAYQNVLNIYYQHPLGERERRSLEDAMIAHGLFGMSVDDAPIL